METVRDWQDTSIFGHVGSAQDNRAKSARVLDYFADSYSDRKEAVYKADRFLSIHDYIARHANVFVRNELAEQRRQDHFLVEPALLRAVHYAFTAATPTIGIPEKKVLALAQAFKALELPG